MHSMITAVRDVVLSFKGKAMTHDQNMAVFNLIESVLGEEAANTFAHSMESSDENHDSKTTYTYTDGVKVVWSRIRESSGGL